MESKNYPPESVEQKVVDVLKTCYDPEIPVDIYELGLIYDVVFDGTNNVHVTRTLRSPACPVAGTLPPEIQQKIVDKVEEASAAEVEVVWDPPWSTDLMSDAAKLELGMM